MRDKGSRGRRRPAYGEEEDFVPFDLPQSAPPRHSPPAQFVAGPVIPATVKWFNPEKGFGFVIMSDGSPDAFLHVSAVEAAGHSELPDGASLTVRVRPGNKGPEVTEIVSVDVSTASPRPRRQNGGPASPVQPAEGTVKFFTIDRGFGFIGMDEGGKDVFVHMNGLQRGFIPQEGQRVAFEVVQGRKGPEARNVRLID
jgi:cold shock protein